MSCSVKFSSSFPSLKASFLACCQPLLKVSLLQALFHCEQNRLVPFRPSSFLSLNICSTVDCRSGDHCTMPRTSVLKRRTLMPLSLRWSRATLIKLPLSRNSAILGSRILRVVILFDEYVSGKITGQRIIPAKAKVVMSESYRSIIDSNVLHHFIELHNDHALFSIERAFSLNELRAGMVLAQDLLNDVGSKLLTEKTILTDEIICRIKVVETNTAESLIVYIKGST